MTREEAIKWLKVEASYIEEDVGNGKELLEAYDIAIKALEQEPCEDCISRQVALKQSRVEYNDDGEGYGVIYIEDIEDLPPVTPQPKTGRWIADVDRWGDIVTTVNGYRCSECNNFNTDRDNYCPNCGCRMKGESE